MNKVQDESKFIGNWLILMIIGYAIVFLFLLFAPKGRVYDVTIAILPTIPMIILIVVTMWYAKTSYQILESSKKETAILDLRVKLQNFYTPLYLRYYVNNPRDGQILFRYLDTRGNEQYYMNRDEKKNIEKIIVNNLHFADDDLEKGLNEILNCTNDFPIQKKRCNQIASLIKAGYKKYKKEYGELISPKNK